MLEVILMRKNVLFKLVFRGVETLLAIVSSIIPFFIYNIASDGGNRSPFLFFTNYSVWLALVAICLSCVFSLLIYLKKKENTPSWVEGVRQAAFIMVFATFVISAFVLPDKIWTAGYWNFASIFKHFLLPIFFMFDVIALSEKHSVKVFYPLTSVVIPLLYWFVVILRFMLARGGNPLPEAKWDYYYPYGFTNIDNGHSLGGLIGLLAGILVGLLIVGYALYFFDKFEDGKLQLKK